jgi:hypothetical protein
MIPSHRLSAVLASQWRRRPGILLAILALAVYAGVLALHMGTYAAGSDCSGYMNHARLLAAGNLHAAPRVLSGLTPEQQRSSLFVPLGFVPAPNGNGMVPTYPVGLPLLVAAAAPVFGWEHAGDVVLCAHSLLGLLLAYALGRMMGLSSRGAVLGATIIGASPLYLNYSIQMMSDLPALVWTLGAVLAAWRSRERAAWAIAAGAAVAMAVLIRPANVMVLAPIAVAFGLSPRRWFLLAAGGFPGAIFFCFHSLSLYGRVFTTGYGNMASSFGPEWIAVTWWHYACWLPVLFTPVVFLAAGLPWLARTERRKTALLGVWALVFAAFYSAYSSTHEAWWYLRFLLPSVPPLVVGGLLVARQAGAGRWWPLVRKRVFVISLIVIVANSSLWNRRLQSLDIGRDHGTYAAAAAWLKANLPANAVILSMQMSGTLCYYTDFTFLRWDSCDANNRPAILAALHNDHRPFYAVLFPFETAAALQQRMPGRWTRVPSFSREPEVWRFETDDTFVRPVVIPSQLHETSTLMWRLPIDQPLAIRRIYLFCNLLSWLVLARLLWQLIPGNDWRDWLARGGVLFSAGAIGSIRCSLTDLIMLALLAGAMLAHEHRRHSWAAGLLGVAAMGRGTTLLALPAVAGVPCFSRSNLRRILPVLALAALSTAVVCWRIGSARQIAGPIAWPFGGILDIYLNNLASIFQGSRLGIAWIGFIALVGITVQAAFFPCRCHDDGPWWRLGMAYVVLMCFLDDSMWRGGAGGATRLLLPLAMAFNVLARRNRVSPAWLLAGNLAVVAGFSSLFFPPDPPSDMAPIRAAGFAQLSDPDGNWYEIESSARHTRAWCRKSARLDIETWPHDNAPLVVSFNLDSLTPRTVIIRQDKQELWSGAVSRNNARATFSCRLTNGHAMLDLATDPPVVAEAVGPYARTSVFAIYDPFFTAVEP